MKKSNLGIAVIMFLLVFSSCSSDETILPQEQSTELLESYTAKRDASGAYYLDLNLENNANVGKFQNTNTNTNEFHLSSSDKIAQKTSLNSDLLFNNGEVKVEFINDNLLTKRRLTIFDNNNTKTAQKSGGNNSLLKEYSITMNGNGSYSVDFEVDSNVDVDFVYNETLSAHEIHLAEGKGNENNFSRTIEKEEGETLNIHFVNHESNAKAELIRKPVIIIDNGEEEDDF